LEILEIQNHEKHSGRKKPPFRPKSSISSPLIKVLEKQMCDVNYFMIRGEFQLKIRWGWSFGDVNALITLNNVWRWFKMFKYVQITSFRFDENDNGSN